MHSSVMQTLESCLKRMSGMRREYSTSRLAVVVREPSLLASVWPTMPFPMRNVDSAQRSARAPTATDRPATATRAPALLRSARMKTSRFVALRSSRVSAVALSALPAIAGAQPFQADPLQLFANQTFQHDSNLLKLPASISPAQITGGAQTSRGDLISVTSAGVRFDREYSLQRVRADATLNAVRYSEYSNLNYLGYNAGGTWNWALGRQWYGEATARGERYLASFADVRTGAKNVVDRTRLRASAGYRFTPAWSVVGALDTSSIANSADAFAYNDSRTNGLEAGARWEPRSGADWQFLWRRADGRYPNRQVRDALGNPLPVTIDNAYSEDRLFTRLGIEPSDRSRLQGDVGITRRRYENLSQRDFSGMTFGLEYAWRGTDAFGVLGYARRDLGALDTLTSSHVDTRVFGLRPSLQLTGKTSVQAQAEHKRLDYVGDPGFVLFPVQQRQDTLTSVSGGVNYEFSRKILLSGTLRWDRRSSNYSQFEFSARAIGVTGEIRY